MWIVDTIDSWMVMGFRLMTLMYLLLIRFAITFPARQEYLDFISLNQEAARSLGFADLKEQWLEM